MPNPFLLVITRRSAHGCGRIHSRINLKQRRPHHTKQKPGSFRSRAFYFRFRHGRTACTRRRVCLHRASIAVSKPTPLYDSPSVGLPLHPPPSALVITASRGRSPQSTRSDLIASPSHSLLDCRMYAPSRVRSDRSSNRVGEATTHPSLNIQSTATNISNQLKLGRPVTTSSKQQGPLRSFSIIASSTGSMASDLRLRRGALAGAPYCALKAPCGE